MKNMIITIVVGAFLASYLIAADVAPKAVTVETNTSTTQEVNKCGAGKCS